MVVSLQSRQLARVCRSLATTAMTLELAIMREDWEVVHAQHDLLVALQREHRKLYSSVLAHNDHRVSKSVARPAD